MPKFYFLTSKYQYSENESTITLLLVTRIGIGIGILVGNSGPDVDALKFSWEFCVDVIMSLDDEGILMLLLLLRERQ